MNKRKRDRLGNLIGESSLSTQQHPTRESGVSTASTIPSTGEAATTAYAGTCERTLRERESYYHINSQSNSQPLRRIMSAIEHNPLVPWKPEAQLRELLSSREGILDDKVATSHGESQPENGGKKETVLETTRRLSDDISGPPTQQDGAATSLRHTQTYDASTIGEMQNEKSDSTNYPQNCDSNRRQQPALQQQQRQRGDEASVIVSTFSNAEEAIVVATNSTTDSQTNKTQTAPVLESPMESSSQLGVLPSTNGAMTSRMQERRREKRKLSLETNTSSEARPKQPPLTEPPIKYSALFGGSNAQESEEVLDIYTYHRGREGMELRDEETGNLLCDLPKPTDTNHNSKEPDTATPVQMQFPLSDIHVFKESITFDMVGKIQAGTTPMQLASDAAIEFGLSFAETIDLAESIERQVGTFCREHNSYNPPISSIDPQSGQRREAQAGRVSVAWHGQISSQTDPGCQVSLAAPVSLAGVRDRRSISSQGQSARGAKTNASTEAQAPKKKKTAKAILASKSAKDDVEDVSRKEIKKRLQECAKEAIKSNVSGSHAKSESIEKGGSPSNVLLSDLWDTVSSLRNKPPTPGPQRHAERKTVPKTPLEGKTMPMEPLERKSLPKEAALRRKMLPKTLVERKTVPKAPVEQKTIPKSPVEQKTIPKSLVERKTIPKSPGQRKTVPKVPSSDLPREMCKEIDLDPGTPMDYIAIYSAKGPELPIGNSASAIEQSPNSLDRSRNTAEDGNVDFCNKCNAPGNLQCCDYCPRAFHQGCLGSTESSETTPWMCPCCSRERAGLPEDLVDGNGVFPDLLKVYGIDIDKEIVRLISIIYGMLVRLIKYDFGHIFAKPVERVPGYDEIIKNPMDLGTVLAKLAKGRYLKEVTVQDVVVQALNDVELVWQNCFLFNCEGSAVYRMAEVQRRRAYAIRMKSFDCLLSPAQRDRINKFRSKFGSKGEQLEVPLPASPKPAKTRIPSKPQSRHRILVSGRGAHAGKSVAVLDPDTCRVVKIYSTISAAILAVIFLAKLKHECEYDPERLDFKGKLRKLMHESSANPAILIFGYRWLFMEDLRDGKVTFNGVGETANDGIDDLGSKIPVLDDRGKTDMPRSIVLVMPSSTPVTDRHVLPALSLEKSRVISSKSRVHPTVNEETGSSLSVLVEPSKGVNGKRPDPDVNFKVHTMPKGATESEPGTFEFGIRQKELEKANGSRMPTTAHS